MRKIYPQNLSAKFIRKIYPQNLSAKSIRKIFIRKIYPQNLSAIFIHKIYPQNLSAKFIRNFYPQNLSAIRNPYPHYLPDLHKVFIALFVEYPLCFLLCHNLHLNMLKTCSIGKTLLSVSCARFKSHICKLSPPPPTLRPRNPCICPCLSRRRRSAQISRLCPFSSRWQAE